MAGIGGQGRPSNNSDSLNLEELEKKYNDIINEIRKLLNGKKDRNQISFEDRHELSHLYLKAAQVAKKLAERHTGSEGEKFMDDYKKLSKAAEKYGSAIQSQVPTTTLEDVKGLDNVKDIVKTFIYMAQHQDIVKYYKIKGGLGLLMYGAPGTGKTMIAEAIAHEMNLPLFVVTPADIFKSYVGESEAAVKQLFEEIDACDDGAILFVDECESIFTKRTDETKDYKAAVTTELLQRINGFGNDGSNRIMIGATNRPDKIDGAYLRYKRFSHLVHVTPPDMVAKRAIIESKLKGIELDGVCANDVLMMTEQYTTNDKGIITRYYSSADLCGIIEEACRLALEKLVETKSNKPIPLTREMFEKAFSKIAPSISSDLLEKYSRFKDNINENFMV